MNSATLGGNVAHALPAADGMIGLLALVNIVMGVMGRVAPQMNIYAIGFPITLSVGLVGITVTLPMLDQPMARLMEQAMDIFMSGP